MNAVLEQFFGILTNSPGSLSFHVVLIFAITGALQGVIYQLSRTQAISFRRATIGLVIILLMQIAYIAALSMAWLSLIDNHAFLPPIDRLITTLCIAWIAWLWAFPNPSRAFDIVFAITNLGVILFYGLNLYIWTINVPLVTFNTTYLESIWQAIGGVIAFFGIIALLAKKPENWGVGALTLLIFMAGSFGQFMLTLPNGDFPGISRISQILGYALLLTLPQRDLDFGYIPRAYQEPYPVLTPPKQEADLKVISLLAETDPQAKCVNVSKIICEQLDLSRCYLTALPDKSGNITVYAGYDASEGDMSGTSLDEQNLPVVSETLQSQPNPILLDSENDLQQEYNHIKKAIGLKKQTPAMLLPLRNADKDPVGGILVFSSQLNDVGQGQIEVSLTSIAPQLGKILQEIREPMSTSVESTDFELELIKSQDQIRALEQEKQDLQNQIEALQQANLQKAEEAKPEESIPQEPEPDSPPRPELIAQNKILSEQMADLRAQLNMTLEELAQAKTAQAEAEKAAKKAKEEVKAPVEIPQHTYTPEQIARVIDLAQEIEQPMTSINGYVEVLLGETVGNLDTAQKEFLDRIKTSNDQIKGNLEKLVGLIKTKKIPGNSPQPDSAFIKLVKSAVADVDAMKLAKRIYLVTEFAENLPQFNPDENSLAQVLHKLLQNAIEATPENGRVTLNTTTVKENGEAFVQIQISDQGGGIGPGDRSRVFTPLASEGEPIAGLGKSTEGLPLAKALVESMNGKIWLDTELGRGSTFNILLPVKPANT